jgi:DNA-binding CsgD family transcriptional regulator/tetratricopeptide (TPR) repeat protein
MFEALFEREAELVSLAGTVEAALGGSGGCACVEGPPGIGKSSLLTAASRLGRERGMRVLDARGGELEREFPFGVVRQLFEPAVVGLDDAARERVVDAAAALAAPALGFELSERGGMRISDPASATLHGLYWLTSNLSADRPLLVVVDDAHWADGASLQFLVYLARRLEGLSVALIVAIREGGQRDWVAPLAELASATSRSVVRPGGLSTSAVGRVLERVSGVAPDPAAIVAVHRATGGNPFLVRELAGVLAADGVPLDSDVSDRVGALAPRTVGRSIMVRLASLDPAAGPVLRSVAILGEHAELPHMAALAGVDQRTAAEAAGQLVRVGLLRDGLPLAFAHPVLRSTVYADMSAAERAELHARAASLLANSGAEPDLVAGQLLLAAPAGEQRVVGRLRAAAASAVARGAAETAVAYLRRALAEPVDVDQRPAVLYELGRAETLIHEPAAVVHLQEARALSRDPVERARYALDLANVLVFVGEWPEVLDLLAVAVEELGDRDESLQLRLTALRLGLVHHPSYAAQLDRETPEFLALARSENPDARALRLYLALLLSVRARGTERVAELVTAGLDGGAFVAEEGSGSLAAANAVHALVHLDRLDQALETAEALLADARARGSVMGFVNGIGTRALTFLRAGALADAEADARAAVALTREHGIFLVEPFVVAYLACVLLERGELAEAEALVDEVTVPDGFRSLPCWPTLLEARARVRGARSERSSAIAIWREVGEIWEDCHVYNPNVSSWRSELALLLAEDEPAAARSLVEHELGLARRAGSSRAVGLALRARGLLAGGEAGLEDLAASASALERSPAVLEHARAMADLGAALRRCNRRSEARAPLARARGTAHRCGALVLTERAQDELRATGARPRRFALAGSEALTASERRVARLAASGLSNREIAQQLFVTVNTVESHLRHGYLKLGVHSRAELPAALSGEPAEPARERVGTG